MKANENNEIINSSAGQSVALALAGAAAWRNIDGGV
jgi:hypothetical protein